VLLTPYPPGIPLLIPGERFNRRIVQFLQFARNFNEKFPGFETDIHGLIEETIGGQVRYFVDCVRHAVAERFSVPAAVESHEAAPEAQLAK
jgi:arginine decarboxylase